MVERGNRRLISAALFQIGHMLVRATKNMVESEFVLLGTEQDADGVPWALLA